MSFDLINNGIIGILNSLGYSESIAVDVPEMPSQEYGNTFILSPISGENDENTSETISSLVYDIQKWEIVFVFPRSSEAGPINFDDISRKRDALIKALDNPANWESYARIQKYKSWKVEAKKSYFVLTIEIKIIDTVIY